MSKHINRRMVLKGLGGACVTAPFLSSIWERSAKAQTASGDAGSGNPKQLIVMYTHYGCITNSWFPANSNGPLAASDLNGTLSLVPLVPYVDKLLIPRGIRTMNQWTPNNNGPGSSGGLGQGNDPHSQVCGSHFTCQPVTPNSNNPFSFSACTKFDCQPIGSSLDHVIAQQLSPSGTPLFMRVGNSGGSAGEQPESNISYLLPAGAAAGTAANIYPGLGTPSDVFSALTGLFTQADAGSMSPDTYAAVKGQSIIDLVKDDLSTLQRVNMSQADQQKLAAWMALLNDAQNTIVTNAQLCNSATATALGATQTNVSKASMLANGGSASGTDVLTSMVTSSLDGADMYSVMAVLAAMCNYNPVIFLKYPPNYVFSGLGIMEEAHALSHRLSNADMTGTCYPDAVNQLLQIDLYYVKKFANLVGMLNGITASDGSTLLDSTATIYFNEMSDGDAHNLNNLPIVQAGSCGGYFKVGQSINVDTSNTGSSTLSVGNSYGQCTADGGADQMADGLTAATGTDPSVANAPINKYFCNIMNALGVMADSTGFPVKGGTQPVTHFGYSDLTTDFQGGPGGTSGAMIHSPGEFTALKA